MKTDRTTKILLTIIAAALVVICGDKIYTMWVPPAEASSGRWVCFEYDRIASGDGEIIASVLNNAGATFAYAASAGGTQGMTCWR